MYMGIGKPQKNGMEPHPIMRKNTMEHEGENILCEYKLKIKKTSMSLIIYMKFNSLLGWV